jgi:hypothetical protein
VINQIWNPEVFRCKGFYFFPFASWYLRKRISLFYPRVLANTTTQREKVKSFTSEHFRVSNLINQVTLRIKIKKKYFEWIWRFEAREGKKVKYVFANTTKQREKSKILYIGTLPIKGLLADHDEIHLYLILNYTLYKNPAFWLVNSRCIVRVFSYFDLINHVTLRIKIKKKYFEWIWRFEAREGRKVKQVFANTTAQRENKFNPHANTSTAIKMKIHEQKCSDVNVKQQKNVRRQQKVLFI